MDQLCMPHWVCEHQVFSDIFSPTLNHRFRSPFGDTVVLKQPSNRPVLHPFFMTYEVSFQNPFSAYIFFVAVNIR